MRLTDRTILSLKSSGKTQTIKDDGYPLFLIVSKTKMVWQVRTTIDKKRHKIKIGEYPAMSLRDARLEAGQIKLGEKTKSVVKTKSGMTVSKAFALYMKEEGEKRKSAAEKWQIFERDIEPKIGNKKMADITHEMLFDMVKQKHETATFGSRLLHSQLSRFFRYSRAYAANQTGLIQNPMCDVPKMSAAAARKRPLSGHELKLFFKSLDKTGQFKNAFETLAYTGKRSQQITQAKTAWFDVDHLKIPSENSKNALADTVWLHPTIRVHFENADGETVFNVAKWTSNAVKRLRKEMDRLNGSKIEPEIRLHDLRDTMMTQLGQIERFERQENKTSDVVKGLLLHHVSGAKSTLAKHYDAYSYYDERKTALQKYGDWLDKIRSEPL